VELRVEMIRELAIEAIFLPAAPAPAGPPLAPRALPTPTSLYPIRCLSKTGLAIVKLRLVIVKLGLT